MSETSPITEQANPETELARDRCSPEDLPHDALQTVPRTEPVVQVLEQINARPENLSVGAGRTQVEEEEEEDVVNDSGRLVQPDAGGSASGGLKRIPSMTRGFPFAVSSLKLVGQAFEDNRNVIRSWLMDDKVSTIGFYGMGGIGKTTILKHIHNELLQRPDIYRHVYWVTVSADFSIYKLQNLIAKHLDLDLSSDYDILPRAAKLSEELTKKKEWILLLDDLWESFELSAVGIPVPLKGCKVILTTRSNDVCHGMDSQVITEVRGLSEREAWTLFMEKLGHGIALSPEVERIAVDIARECFGLPLGIITMAGSLRGVDDQDEWRRTLKILKEIKSRDKGDEVFRMLRFSYDRLDDVALQQCLLYCASFPEDYIIKREELIFYLIDEGIIQKMGSREATFDKGHTMLDRLENVGLLQRIDGGRAVQMHDLVRDIAKEQRKGIEMAGSNIDPFWNDVEQTNDGIMKCVFCGHLFPKDTSISRIKVHLAGERGRGVTICGQVPKQVQEAAFLSMHGGNSCSPEELPHDTFQTIPRTELVVQVLGQSNVELDNFSMGAERTQVEEEEEDMLNNSGRVAQPGAGASSSGGLRHNPSETRGAPLLTGSTRLVGQAFEENKNVIWSWLTDDDVSTIGIYGMGGSGKTTMVKHINNELLQSPDISHHVYWVTVSRDFSVPKLQNKIAKRIQLSFSNEEEELEHRATELSQELMKKQRWILILDDLWKSFDLHKVGIPAPLKGCKLLITTRSETVCREMDSTNYVRVNPLSNEEAWTLFMEVLGHDRPLSPQVEQVARDITRECAGLPLGIKTIAGTMKGVDGMHEWRYVLEHLKQSKVPQDKMEDEVFRILRFSYTHLRDRALQQCFVYCGLYPEDFEIHREDLIDYLIDEGVVKRQKSREVEINEGHTMLDRLERACLLERLGGGDCVKMHDLIRDMAIQILQENSQAMVKAGAQLRELPDEEEWTENFTRVSLMHNEIKEICSRHSPRCPNLSTKLKGLVTSSFGVCGNHNAISTSQQEQNKEVYNNEVTNAISASTQQQNNEMMMAHQRGDLSLEDWMASITVEDEVCLMEDDNGTGGVAQPGAGASSSGGLRHNRSETRGAPLLTGSIKLVGRAFEENRNVIWSWLTDDEVSIIGIYGMAGAGKTTLLKHICNELQRSPDIYYPVYWVTLSPDFSIHKLQNKIAKCIQLSFSNEEKELGLRAEKLSQKLTKKQRCWKEEELGRRAKELSQELMKKQRWILILDNLCNSFELNKVGIPVPFKRCKLIMTTRSEEVCLQMNSKYNVRVNPLPREESWTLWYLQGGFLCCQGQGRKMIASGWTLLMTNLILEIASAGFDQLGYALVGMVLAFVALVLAAADLIHMPRKERTSLLPSFHRQSASTFVGTIVEYFGLVGGVWQCFYSTVEYAYAHQKRDNPIKMCLLPFLFLSCVVISILIKKSYIDKRA